MDNEQLTQEAGDIDEELQDDPHNDDNGYDQVAQD